MAIKNFNELYWKLFNIAGGGTEADVTKVLDSIVRSDRSKLDQYFTNAVDQIAFDTEDWSRLRAFFIDLFTAHRSLITNSAGISDPHFLNNSDLDELFRSFGFTESTVLKDFDENPLENKVQLFLDLVNLYKIKGTPRSILEVLQYYGIPELDIFEFWLQKERYDQLVFKGDVIVGTSNNPSAVYLPYDLLTQGDPHWLLTHSQILAQDAANKINLPSKSPYFAVQPIVEVGIENSILVRLVQDQYDAWEATGDLPPQDAEITILGVVSSLLELYLLTLYSFQKDYQIGTAIDRFACYDGTNTSAVDILAEYDELLQPPITRDIRAANYETYLDLFTRERDRHFLYGPATAESVLNLINPTLIADLESLTSDNTTVLQSLLKDLAVWVRNNVGFGFVNLGYIFFGLNQLFEDLKPVINFFKPYRARLIVLELLKFGNVLTESIPIEDSASFSVDIETFDYMTGNSAPCCMEGAPTGPQYVYDSTSGLWILDNTIQCLDTTANVSTYSRDTYDCGSYHDIGAVVDHSPIELSVDQYIDDHLRCPAGPCADVPDNLDGTHAVIFAPDSTDCTDLIPLTCENVPIVHSETIIDTLERIEDLVVGSDSFTVLFPEPYDNDLYNLNVNIFSEVPSASMYGVIVTSKTTTGFTVLFSGPLDAVHYKMSWTVNPTSTVSGSEYFTQGQDNLRVNFVAPLSTSNYSIATSISNEVDTVPSIYNFTVVERDVAGFKLQMSSPIDSTSYELDWNVFDSTSFVPNGLVNLPEGQTFLDVNLNPVQVNDQYSLVLTIMNTVDVTPSIYSYIVTKKNSDEFTVRFSSPIDSTNYYLSWAVTYETEQEFIYRQESGFRWFDTMGRFDCTHGFDMVEITMDIVSQDGVILQENGFWLLQEDAVDPNQDDYGLLIE